MKPGGLVLAIDCGNSRLKWGVCAPDQESAEGVMVWLAQGSMEVSGIARLADLWTFQAEPDAIVISNVAGPGIAELITRGLAHWSAVPQWIRSREAQCGVINGYADPSRLGVDRWAALVGARALNPGDCLVVMAGTATTVDVLTREGIAEVERAIDGCEQWASVGELAVLLKRFQKIK